MNGSARRSAAVARVAQFRSRETRLYRVDGVAPTGLRHSTRARTVGDHRPSRFPVFRPIRSYDSFMQVLWWLVPPVVCTLFAMGWVAWAGRERTATRRDDSEAAMRRIEEALGKPTPRTARSAARSAVGSDRGASTKSGSHGVIVRPASGAPGRS
jgi:hypothetical protein